MLLYISEERTSTYYCTQFISFNQTCCQAFQHYVKKKMKRLSFHSPSHPVARNRYEQARKVLLGEPVSMIEMEVQLQDPCVLCYDSEIDTKLSPCGHYLCRGCILNCCEMSEIVMYVVQSDHRCNTVNYYYV
jgi:hypothetical protein